MFQELIARGMRCSKDIGFFSGPGPLAFPTDILGKTRIIESPIF